MIGHFGSDMSSQTQNRLAQEAFQIAPSILDFINGFYSGGNSKRTQTVCQRESNAKMGYCRA